MIENIKFKVNGERYGILSLQSLGLSSKLIHEDLMTSYQCSIIIFLSWLGFLTLRLMWHSWPKTDSDTNTETPWHPTSNTYHNHESDCQYDNEQQRSKFTIYRSKQQRGNSQDVIWQQCLFLDTPTAMFSLTHCTPENRQVANQIIPVASV